MARPPVNRHKKAQGNDTVPAQGAACNKCAFIYDRCTRERDAYRADSNRPTCAWYTTGVPPDILRCETECRHYAEKK